MTALRKERLLQISLVIITLVMTILRFLLNEKGRITPDSMRFMKFANHLPEIDNTIAPTGYPIAIKFFTLFGFDEFWSSKLLGLFAYLFIIGFAWKNKFYWKESLLTLGLVSYVSIFSYTISEAFILPFVFLLLYIVFKMLNGKISTTKSIFYLSIILILLYNIRYNALFFIIGCGIFGLLKKRKEFFISSMIGVLFVILYKFLFIDYFNSNYVSEVLDVGIHPTSKLLNELFKGLTVSFNPFIHMANPNGGYINLVIFCIGLVNIVVCIYLFIKKKLTEAEQFFIIIGLVGIMCSFFIQYFYSVDAIDYRLSSPFLLPIWLVYFKKMLENLGALTYSITFISLITGFSFIWLSKGNYLENRKAAETYLKAENLHDTPIQFYVPNDKDLEAGNIAEIISTVNSDIIITSKAPDTIQHSTLTRSKVLKKVKFNNNKYQ